MAKLIKGILGHLRGSVGHVTGRQLYGKGVISRKNTKGGIVNSQLQLNQQLRMKSATLVTANLYNNFAKKFIYSDIKLLSVWNATQLLNFDNFDENGLIDPKDLIVSNGTLKISYLDSLTVVKKKHQATLVWSEYPTEPSGNPLDRFNVMMYNLDLHEFFYPSETAIRSDGVIVFSVPENWDIGQYVIALCCYSNPSDNDNSSLTMNAGDIIG